MKSFIFITNEGFTYQPDSESSVPDIENSQVIGCGNGENAREAFFDMLKSNGYLLETSFDEVIGLELTKAKREYFYLSEYKAKCKANS